MSVFKDLQKSFKSHHLIALLGVVILIAALSQYSGRKGSSHEGIDPNQRIVSHNQNEKETNDLNAENKTQDFHKETQGMVQPANPMGQNEVYASASDISNSSNGLPSSCSRQPVSNPKDLLPNDSHNEFSRLNPKGSHDVSNVNLLSSGYHAGINTVGGSLRNANLQLRSEPPNPTKGVSPWMNSTIEPDLMRTPLEIGCGPQ